MGMHFALAGVVTNKLPCILVTCLKVVGDNTNNGKKVIGDNGNLTVFARPIDTALPYVWPRHSPPGQE